MGFRLFIYWICLQLRGVTAGGSRRALCNSQIVQHGVNGILPGTVEKWHQYLNRLILDPALRATLGLAGRRTVEETYSLQAQAPWLWEMLLSVVEN